MAGKRRGPKPTAALDENVIRFPPLPRVPPPPRFPKDIRQRNTMHVLSAMLGIAQKGMSVAGPNLGGGFRAAAVDLGRLQEVLERGLSRFDPSQMEARWPELFRWIAQVLRTWVQRTKHMKIERHPSGVHIEMETQDDRGYYHYAFDVFPERTKR